MHRMLLVAFITLSLSTASLAGENCRTLIVDTYKILGANINPMSFSSTSFEALNISIEEFNSISSDDQQMIYTLIKPMRVSADEAIETINSFIERYTDTPFEYELIDELQALRLKREALRFCTI